MAKWANDSVLDAPLDAVATSNQLIVTSSQPANRAAAISGALASISVDSGDFAKADGSPNGRKLTVAQQENISITSGGNATHVCLVDSSNLLIVTTVTSQALTSGNTLTVPSWEIRITDPS